MQTTMVWTHPEGFTARLRQMKKNAEHAGLNTTKLQRDIRQTVINDNTSKILWRHVDKGGNQLAPLAPSTLKNKKRGTGPALAPHGMYSQFIKNFRAVWVDRGEKYPVLLTYYSGIIDKHGRPFGHYHLQGTRHLPKRDVAGLSLQGWMEVQELFHEFAQDVADRIVKMTSGSDETEARWMEDPTYNG